MPLNRLAEDHALFRQLETPHCRQQHRRHHRHPAERPSLVSIRWPRWQRELDRYQRRRLARAAML